MNYYERYCGDYARDTSHLSLAEHGAYTLMLDVYYSTEKALPADLGLLHRMCRAITKIEQASVNRVADEFFPVGQDGLRHNRRADRDIAKALPRIAKARDNGGKGGRPKKNPAGSEKPPEEKPNGFPETWGKETQQLTQPGEASPSPIPQTPSLEGVAIPSDTVRPPLPKTLTHETWNRWKKHLIQKGKPMTAEQEGLQLVKLGQHADPEAVVLDTIEKGRANLPPIGGHPSDQQQETPAQRRAKVAAEMFGNRSDDGVIDGTAERVA